MSTSPRIGLTATVSGSFHQGMTAVQEAVASLTDAGVTVLSPADPRVVDAFGDFLFVASDRRRTIKLIQDRHLAAIAASDFLWLVAPGGYVGLSAAMEIGAAVDRGTPVFCAEPPTDLTLRQYVTVVTSIQQAVLMAVGERASMRTRRAPSLLLHPECVVDEAHSRVDTIGRALAQRDHEYSERDLRVESAARDLQQMLQGLSV